MSKTQTELDDRVLDVLHRPIFTTVALIGLLLAAEPLELGPQVSLFTTSTVKTLLIIIWLVFAVRFSRLVLEAMRREEERFQLGLLLYAAGREGEAREAWSGLSAVDHARLRNMLDENLDPGF